MLIFISQVGEFWTYMENSGQTIRSFLAAQLTDTALIMTIIIFNHQVLIRYFLDRKKYTIYVVLLLMAIFTAGYATGFPRGGWAKVNTISFYYAYFTIAGMAVFFLHRNFRIAREANEQRELQKEMELNYLKGQVNPHFFFNSLNTIYALSRLQSKNTADVVMQLSDLMRYQLETARLERVPLSMEVDFINNYLLLEEQRLSDRCNIEFSIDGEVKGLSIAPMLLIPLAENAIKHGAQNTINDSKVEVRITVNGSELKFQVNNSRPAEAGNVKSTGIGLANLKRRLELLYPDKYALKIAGNDHSHEAVLTLNLV